MRFQFIIDKDTINELDAIDPIGWEDISLALVRDQYHGVAEGFPSKFGYHGAAYTALKAKYDTSGIQASATLTVNYACSDTDSYTLLYEGVFDFTSVELNEDDCIIEIETEPSSCRAKFINRLEEKVEIPTATTLTIPTKTIIKLLKIEDDGSGEDERAYSYSFTTTGENVRAKSALRIYGSDIVYSDDPLELTNNSCELVNIGDCHSVDPSCGASLPSPSGLSDDKALYTVPSEAAGHHTFEWNFDISASAKAITAFATTTGFEAFYLELALEIKRGGTVLKNTLLASDNDSDGYPENTYVEKILTNAGSYTTIGESTTGLEDGLQIGDIVNLIAKIGHGGGYDNELPGTFTTSINLFQKAHVRNGSYFKISLDDSSNFPSTSSNVAMIDIALDAIIDDISDSCLSLYSEYYGRTDGVNTTATDGCGGLRCLSPGLAIRQFPNAKLFLSMKQVFDDLNGIDNIGMNIVDDEVIIENVRAFYENSNAILLDYVPNIKIKFDESMVINNLITGYNKWEAEEFNGLDEFNTKREYSNGISQTRGNKNVQSDFIASAYAAEVTRRVSFLGESTKDYKYDNDIFIFCLKRDSGNLIVDQGNITDATNIIDPSTIYNLAISPARNAIRWFKSVITGIKDYTSAALTFKYGEGNYTAEGNYTGLCSVENDAVLSENQTINYSDITADHKDPLFTGELIEVDEFMLSKSQYDTIKANSTKLIGVSKTDQDHYLGWIKELKYLPNKGTVKMTLIKKP